MVLHVILHHKDIQMCGILSENKGFAHLFVPHIYCVRLDG